MRRTPPRTSGAGAAFEADVDWGCVSGDGERAAVMFWR